MAKIYTSADQLVGHTPLLELTHLEAKYNLKAKVVYQLLQPLEDTRLSS